MQKKERFSYITNILKLNRNKIRKSQAAMEFLMTYGWALMVVLLVIGGLAYFGILDANKFLPESVDLGSGLFVQEYSADEGAIVLYVENGLGRNIYDLNFSTLCYNEEKSTINYNIKTGEGKWIGLPCNLNERNNRLKSSVNISYKTRVNKEYLDHSKKGNLNLNVRRGTDNAGNIFLYLDTDNMNMPITEIAQIFISDSNISMQTLHNASIVNDASSSYTPTCSNCPTWDSDEGAYLFDGSNDAIDTNIPNNDIETYDELFISVWFKPTSQPPSGDGYVIFSNTKNNYASIECVLNNDMMVWFGAASTYPSWNIAKIYDVVELNNWYFAAMSLSSEGIISYLNGEANISSETFTGIEGQNGQNFDINIGHRPDRADTYYRPGFNGYIGDFIVSNKSLTLEEIDALYNLQKKFYE